MTPAAVRRIPRPFSALTALVVLTLSAALALVGAPGHAAPQADSDLGVDFTVNLDLVIKSNESFTVKMQMVDSSTAFEAITEDTCSADSFKDFDSEEDYFKDAKFTFKEEGDTRTCTIEGSGKVADAKGITHEKGEYIVDSTDSGSNSSDFSSAPGIEFNYSVTFPGKVTEADGGKVTGNKVTFSNSLSHKVKGKDGTTPVWVWILVGVGAVGLIGGSAAALLIMRRKKSPQPYAAPGQGYEPQQIFPAQPGQSSYDGQQDPYGTPQAQPGQSPYDGQQNPYGTPQAQPGQSPYDGQHPGQSTY